MELKISQSIALTLGEHSSKMWDQMKTNIVLGHSEPAPTHQCTIHWMAVISQLWMNFINWVHIWFNLGNQFCKKLVSCIR